MTVLEEDELKFVRKQDVIFQKAKRLLYKYGDQTPFTEEEMKKVLRLLEILDLHLLTGERQDGESV